MFFGGVWCGRIADMSVLLIIQMVVSVLLIGAVMLQSQGGGLGSSFAQASYHTKRGMEKGLFVLTIGLAVVFVISSVINLVY